jgi:hypothetical protein
MYMVGSFLILGGFVAVVRYVRSSVGAFAFDFTERTPPKERAG